MIEICRPKELNLSSWPETTLRDYQIRSAMGLALQLDDLAVAEISRELTERHMSPILSVVIDRPFSMPNLGSEGSNNIQLCEFAFEAYEVLAKHFGDQSWGEWFIAPYFIDQENMQQSVELGVFAEDFDQTVVE